MAATDKISVCSSPVSACMWEGMEICRLGECYCVDVQRQNCAGFQSGHLYHLLLENSLFRAHQREMPPGTVTSSAHNLSSVFPSHHSIALSYSQTAGRDQPALGGREQPQHLSTGEWLHTHLHVKAQDAEYLFPSSLSSPSIPLSISLFLFSLLLLCFVSPSFSLKDVDEAAMNRVQLERKVDALHDEINFLKKVHDEVSRVSMATSSTSLIFLTSSKLSLVYR